MSILHFIIGSPLVTYFTHWLAIHWFIALKLLIGCLYQLETHIGYSHWISLDWNHQHWNNGRTEASIVSHWIRHSSACIIGYWLNLVLKPCTQSQSQQSDNAYNVRSCCVCKLVS